jgi:hypothetical protein
VYETDEPAPDQRGLALLTDLLPPPLLPEKEEAEPKPPM